MVMPTIINRAGLYTVCVHVGVVVCASVISVCVCMKDIGGRKEMASDWLKVC